jgi:hypothetical protein
MVANSRILEQIEKSAGLYQPAVYELLSFYQALENQEEPLDGQFIPMTTVQTRSPQETKIFAVGLIPPSIRVPGRLLDRSASVSVFSGDALAASTATAEEVEALGTEEVLGNWVNTVEGAPSSLSNSSTVTPSANAFRRSESAIASTHPSIQPLIRKLIAAAAAEGISIVALNGLRTNAQQDALFAKGRTAPGNVVTGVKGGESWHNFGLAVDFAMVSPGPSPSLGSAYFPSQWTQWGVVGGLGKQLGMIWGGDFSNIHDPGHFEYHPGFGLRQARAGVVPPVPTEVLPVRDVANSTGTWVATGAPNANQAARTASLAANKALNETNLGKQFQAQQQATINMMQAALEQMAKTPPLRLLVNPQSFKVSAEKIISDGNWGRNGYIVEHWGDAQDKIDGSGKVAAFYSMDAQNATGPGLTRTARQFSTSYQNLLALWLIYKNNGGVWLPDPIVRTGHAKNLAVVGSVYLYFDEILYVGSFDNFSLTESETAPFTLDYNFTFTVRSWYLLDHQDDPQYMYGRPGPAAPSIPTGTGNSPTMGGNNPQPSPEVALPPDVALGVFNDPEVL